MKKKERAIFIIIAAYIGGQMLRPFFQNGFEKTVSSPSIWILISVVLSCLAIVVYNSIKLFKRVSKNA